MLESGEGKSSVKKCGQENHTSNTVQENSALVMSVSRPTTDVIGSRRPLSLVMLSWMLWWLVLCSKR